MIREFCDRCEEIISPIGNYCTGSTVYVPHRVEDADRPMGAARVWKVQTTIEPLFLGNKPWKLCPLCAAELMDEANQMRIVEKNKREEKK